MSTDTATAAAPGHDAHDDEHHDHPSDAQYWKVGAILGVITLAEVSTYFVTDDPYSHDLAPLLIGGLLVMMTAKFITIGAYFMHLKFDHPLLRTVFVSGLVLAMIVYAIMMFAVVYWFDDYEAAVGAIPLLVS